jgi:hypothetical protein
VGIVPFGYLRVVALALALALLSSRTSPSGIDDDLRIIIYLSTDRALLSWVVVVVVVVVAAAAARKRATE